MTMLDAPSESMEGEEVVGRSRKKLLMLLILVVLLAGVAGWWFMLRPAAADAPPEPGAVLKLEPIQVNLKSGHYLRLGLALQASKDAGEELEGSKALDVAIELFSGQDMSRLLNASSRDQLKHQLERRLGEAYEGEVIGVYFTDFVTQ